MNRSQGSLKVNKFIAVGSDSDTPVCVEEH